jgi:hypothetical protein
VIEPSHSLTLQLLEWLSARPRSYSDVIEAWRTSCPRLSIWEDACIAGLVHYEPDGDRIVRLSPKRETLLQGLPQDRSG